MEMLGGIGALGAILLLFVAILWILMPFAVFGTKDLIEEQIKQQKKTNELLERLSLAATGDSVTVSPETHVKCPDCRELVLKDARKCKHCGCTLTPQ